MNKKEFAEYICKEVSKQDGIYAYISEVPKNNGVVFTGLTIKAEGSEFAPTIYLEGFYEAYCNGEDIDSVVERIMELYEKRRNSINVDISFFRNYESAKEQILYRLINYEANRELLKNIPHKRIFDLAKVYYVALKLDDMQATGTITITNSHIEGWKVTLDDLESVAAINTPKRLPKNIQPIEEITQIPFPEECTLKMYVASNPLRMNGAAILCYESLLGDIAERFRDDVIIIPSSIHELIFFTGYDDDAVEHVKAMVREVNRTEVEPEEVLSDNVYIYRHETNKIEML